MGFSFREGRLSAGRPERAGESVRRGLLGRPGALYLLVTLALIGAYAVALPLAAAHSSSTGKGSAFVGVAFGMIPLSAFVAVSAALSVLGGAFRTMKWAVPGTYVCAVLQLIPPLMLLLEGGALMSAMGLALAALTYAYGDVGELSRRPQAPSISTTRGTSSRRLSGTRGTAWLLLTARGFGSTSRTSGSRWSMALPKGWRGRSAMRGSRTMPRPAPPCEGGVAHALRSRPWGFWAGLCAACALAFSIATTISETPAFPFGELLFWTALLLALCVLGRTPAARRAMGPAEVAGSALYSLAGGALLFGSITLLSPLVGTLSVLGFPGMDSKMGVFIAAMVFQFLFVATAAALLLGAVGIAGFEVQFPTLSGVVRVSGSLFFSAWAYVASAMFLSPASSLPRVASTVIFSFVGIAPFFLLLVFSGKRSWILVVDREEQGTRRIPLRCIVFSALLSVAGASVILLFPALSEPFGVGLVSRLVAVGYELLAGGGSEKDAVFGIQNAFSESAPTLAVEVVAFSVAAVLSLLLAVLALPKARRGRVLRLVFLSLAVGIVCTAFYEGAGLALYRVSSLFEDVDGFLQVLRFLCVVALPLALASAALLAARAASGARGPAPAEGVEGAVGDARE